MKQEFTFRIISVEIKRQTSASSDWPIRVALQALRFRLNSSSKQLTNQRQANHAAAILQAVRFGGVPGPTAREPAGSLGGRAPPAERCFVFADSSGDLD